MDRPSRRDAHAQADGERLPLVVKDLGSCDLYPQSLAHNPNGRFVTVCGDGEYIIYTALAWRNKSFGAALEFVWGDDSSVFATRESPSSVKLFRNFKEAAALRPDFAVEGLAGGALLSLRAPDFVVFYDWATAKARRPPAVPPRAWAARGRVDACGSRSLRRGRLASGLHGLACECLFVLGLTGAQGRPATWSPRCQALTGKHARGPLRWRDGGKRSVVEGRSQQCHAATGPQREGWGVA